MVYHEFTKKLLTNQNVINTITRITLDECSFNELIYDIESLLISTFSHLRPRLIFLILVSIYEYNNAYTLDVSIVHILRYNMNTSCSSYPITNLSKFLNKNLFTREFSLSEFYREYLRFKLQYPMEPS